MKAILVIDMPEELIGKTADLVLLQVGEIQVGNKDRTIKPMPQKTEENDIPTFSSSFERGWNACLDEITGETE